MLYSQIKKGATDQMVVIRIVDSVTGVPETGVEHNTSGIDLKYWRPGATVTNITEAALAAVDSAHSDGGIEHLGGGYYRLDLPDAAFATGAPFVLVFGTITDMVVLGAMVQLVDADPADLAAVKAKTDLLPTATRWAQIKAALFGKTSVNTGTGVVTFYDEDGTTPTHLITVVDPERTVVDLTP